MSVYSAPIIVLGAGNSAYISVEKDKMLNEEV